MTKNKNTALEEHFDKLKEILPELYRLKKTFIVSCEGRLQFLYSLRCT